MTSWVSTEVVTGGNVKKRRAIITRFILIAQHLFEMRNFSTAYQIVSGLASAAVARMAVTWDGLSARSTETWTRLRNTLNPLGSWKAYARFPKVNLL